MLVLPGKVVLAERPAYSLEHRQGFSLRMERFTDSASHRTGLIEGFDDVSFIFFRDGGKSHVLPVFLLQNVPNQIVLMQPLHNNKDAAGLLVIQSAIESVVIPLVHVITLRFRNRLIRF